MKIKIIRDFISEEKRKYKFRLGRVLASALSGFLMGAIAATIFWVVVYLQLMETLT